MMTRNHILFVISLFKLYCSGYMYTFSVYNPPFVRLLTMHARSFFFAACICHNVDLTLFNHRPLFGLDAVAFGKKKESFVSAFHTETRNHFVAFSSNIRQRMTEKDRPFYHSCLGEILKHVKYSQFSFKRCIHV